MYYFADIHTVGVEATAQLGTVSILTLFRSTVVADVGARRTRTLWNTSGYAGAVIRRFGRSRTVDILSAALLALWPQASDSAISVLGFLTCKTRVVPVPSPKRDREDAVGSVEYFPEYLAQSRPQMLPDSCEPIGNVRVVLQLEPV